MSDTLAGSYVTLPPTQAELPYDDGEPMESQRHKLQDGKTLVVGSAREFSYSTNNSAINIWRLPE